MPMKYNHVTHKRPGFVDPHAVRNEAERLAREERLLERQSAALAARDELLSYIRYTMPDADAPDDLERSRYKDARIHRKICRAVELVENGEIPFLILVTAPRHGKSEIVSRRLPAWYSGRHPDHDIVVATYNDDFAADFGAEVRQIVTGSQHKQVFPGYRLRRGGTAKDRLQTDKGGLLSFVGRGGSLTGRGAHLLVCDDLIKDDKEAMSQAIRDAAWNWLTKVAMTRRRGKKLVIITTTRWHVDDPVGRLTNDNIDENPYYNEVLAKRIKIINLPAIADEDDDLGRAPGEALWPDGPDNFDIDFLEEQRALLGPLNFEALYQGRPTLVDGILFRRENIQLYNPADLPKELRYYCASDHAVGLKQRNDFTVLLKAGVDAQEDIWLTDCWWHKAPTDQVVEAILAMIANPATQAAGVVGGKGPHRQVDRSVPAQATDGDRALAEHRRGRLHRRQAAARAVHRRRSASGKLHLPAWAGWTGRAIEQMLAFPNGTHDDFVDPLALIGMGLQRQYGPDTGQEAESRAAARHARLPAQERQMAGREAAADFAVGMSVHNG